MPYGIAVSAAPASAAESSHIFVPPQECGKAVLPKTSLASWQLLQLVAGFQAIVMLVKDEELTVSAPAFQPLVVAATPMR